MKLYDLGQIAHIGDSDSEGDDDELGLGRTKQRFHRSEKVLGKLFRGVDEKKIWDENIKLGGPQAVSDVWDSLMSQVHTQILKTGLDIDYQRRTEEAWTIQDL